MSFPNKKLLYLLLLNRNMSFPSINMPFPNRNMTFHKRTTSLYTINMLFTTRNRFPKRNITLFRGRGGEGGASGVEEASYVQVAHSGSHISTKPRATVPVTINAF